jgi:Rrf2 family protein
VKLTSKGELALKAMIELAKAEIDSSGGLSAAEIARRCKASVKFLEQVMTSLRSAGYVISSRGRLGGYRLARDADEIVIGATSRLIDGPLAPAPCASVTQHQACGWCESEEECDLKKVWVQVRDATARVMDSISLADLARNAAERHPIDRYVI